MPLLRNDAPQALNKYNSKKGFLILLCFDLQTMENIYVIDIAAYLPKKIRKQRLFSGTQEFHPLI